MTNQESFSLSKTLNADHPARVTGVRQVIGPVFDPAVDISRESTPEECECPAAVNRLFDIGAETCPDCLPSSGKPDRSPENAAPADRSYMDKWEKLIKNKAYITDLGKNCTMEFHTVHAVIGRYIVWMPKPNSDRHFIAEEGNDLEELMRKHDIPLQRVQRLGAFIEEDHQT